MSEKNKDQVKFSRSMRLQIALFYILLAMANIVFFSVLIYDQQMDLLLNNFRLNSKELVNVVLGDVQEIYISEKKDESYEQLQRILKSHSIEKYRIFNENGIVLHKFPETLSDSVSDDMKRKMLEIGSDSSIFKTRFHIELDSSNFNTSLLLPLNQVSRDSQSAEKKSKQEAKNIFLEANLSIASVRTRLQSLYYTLAMAVGWGVLFHIAFGFYVYRLIFVRVARLKDSSSKMAEGDLHARALWKMTRKDELDDLGLTFNKMAQRIEDQFETVNRLNREIQNELEIGKDVQSVFLPDPDILFEYRPSLYYQPMREVSGDIYGFYKMNEKKIVFFADATGHGISAALVTTITIMSLDYILENYKNKELDPGKILGELNMILSLRLKSAFFATAVMFVFDKSHTVQFSNAGHNSPILLKRNGDIKELEHTGPPLGMIDDFEYDSVQLQLQYADKLLIYSDGLTEGKKPETGELFGMPRVKNILSKYKLHKCEQIKNALVQELDNHTDGINDDDVSMILLEIPS